MRSLIFLLLTFSSLVTFGQDHTRFREEVEELTASTSSLEINSPIVFAGSSSIRYWDTKKYFPEKPIINHGFGGSETSDLICYARELILRPRPTQLFIYEGDNDLSSGKTVDVVVADMKTLLRVIKRSLPETQVHIISPKPSIARWNLREKYVALNQELKSLCESKENVAFIDVWSEMLQENGDLDETLFKEDGLHMNEKGYRIWTEAVLAHID